MPNNNLTKTYTINTLGQTILPLNFPQFPATFTFAILVSSGATYTLLTAIASDGTFVEDSFYNNYTQNSQDRANSVGAFGIDVINLGSSGIITIEIKTLS